MTGWLLAIGLMTLAAGIPSLIRVEAIGRERASLLARILALVGGVEVLLLGGAAFFLLLTLYPNLTREFLAEQ